MNDETNPVGLWDRTKTWADKNRTISGALVGGAAGTIVPGSGPSSGRSSARGLDLPHRRKRKKTVAAARPIPKNTGPRQRCRRAAPLRPPWTGRGSCA
jgi:hypothetical protein